MEMIPNEIQNMIMDLVYQLRYSYCLVELSTRVYVCSCCNRNPVIVKGDSDSDSDSDDELYCNDCYCD